MHNPESILKNKTQKILWDFEIQTNRLISARQTELEIVNKKKKKEKKRKEKENCCLDWPRSKIERKQRESWVPEPC